MHYPTNTDNIYAKGSFISAKEAPATQLKIVAYKQRIYYCSVVGNEARKQLAYFERELVPPAVTFLLHTEC
ncbi:MAG TPA: hypothetical protein VGD40_06465 [Chryseosolibacter sp.]